jgi:hypothetical protein
MLATARQTLFCPVTLAGDGFSSSCAVASEEIADDRSTAEYATSDIGCVEPDGPRVASFNHAARAVSE